MMFTGFAAVAYLLGPGWMALVSALVLLGEAAEILVLKHLQNRMGSGCSVGRAQYLSTIAGAFQALTLASVFLIIWFVPKETETVFLTFAYLSVAAMNAGARKSLHPKVATAKLAIFGCTATFCLLFNMMFIKGVSLSSSLDFLAAITLGLMVKVFVGHAEKNFKRHRQSERDLIRRQKIVELAAQELQDKQKELRMLSMVARCANDAVVLSDSKYRITWVNDAFTRMSGFSYDEAVGMTPAELLNSHNTDARVVAELANATQSGTPFRGELINIRKDGTEIWVETNVVPVVGDDGTVEMIVAVERDISQAKQHEQELALARHDAERGDRAKSEFLANMSHEIRTPMNGVIGMADLLCESDLDADQAVYATTIRSSAQALLRIINDILDFSKLDAGKLALDPVDFALGPTILAAMDLLRPHAQDKGLHLDVGFETRLPALVSGDDGRLRQILINLVGNAIKFTDTGGVSVSVRHSETKAGIAVQIEVADTGIGIAPKKLESIFDHFSQVDAATTRRFGGTGLGLSISRHLARQMNGDIRASSHQGQGSVFTLEITLAPAEGETPTDQRETSLPDVSRLDGLRVLLAEDNRTNRLLIERYLAQTKVELISVENGQMALEATENIEPDVILMDMSMPVMDGLAATRAIREHNPHGPQIVALTANAFASDRKTCLDAGMDDFLTKPIKRADLLAALVRATDRLRGQHQVKDSA